MLTLAAAGKLPGRTEYPCCVRAVKRRRCDLSTTRNHYRRHGGIAALAALLTLLFWFSRREWDPEMRLWRAFGDAAFVLLFITLLIGPLTRLWGGFAAMMPWRRYTGIWFAILSVVHTLLIWKGWARWDVYRFLGYEYIPQLGRLARLEPGFGLANVLGSVALVWAVVLMVTSMEWAVRSLGGSAWKWLHHSAHTVFYLTGIHSTYYLFLHYTPSFHRPVPPANWFRWPVALMIGIVLVVQFLAYVRTVKGRVDEPRSQRGRLV